MKNKKYILGIITGSVITFILMLSFASADEFGFSFNMFRISVNGVDRIRLGENISYSTGEQMPGSICYKDTTYVPLRMMAESLGYIVNYNDELKTIFAYDNYESSTGGKNLVSKEDLNGNTWEYSIKKIDDRLYLSVKEPSLHGNERIYRIPNDKCYKVTDDSIYFLRCTHINESRRQASVVLQKIDFLNDENTRDGTQLSDPIDTDLSNANLLFDDNLIICAYYVYFSTQAHSDIHIYDYKNNKSAYCYLIRTRASITEIENTGDTLILNYGDANDPSHELHSVKYNKSTMEFYDNPSILSRNLN